MTPINLLITTAAVAAMSGCATTAQFPGAVPDGAPGATIQGIGGTAGNFLAPAFITTKDVLVSRVNGIKVNFLGQTYAVRVAPGRHLLQVDCTFKFLGRLVLERSEISLDAEDGHIYQLDAEMPCRVSVTDVPSAKR